METLTYNLSRWTTDELIGEVVRRTAADGPALRSVETAILRARLAQSDRRFGDGVQPELEPGQRAGVRGTVEVGLAEDDAWAALATIGDHGVDAATLGAHTHDHSHRKRSQSKLAAHDHHHLHLEDGEADGQFNGHTHARAHALLPWERTDPA